MKFLIIGSGGREHAIASSLKKSSLTEKIFVCPGNGGTQEFDNIELDLTAPYNEIKEFCKKENISLIVVGPENYLADGLVDYLEEIVPVFGPSKEAAHLESSKIFAKEIMREAGVPTADYLVFEDPNSAERHLENRDLNYVIKADGLCAGKGVVVPDTSKESLEAIKEFLILKKHGKAGEKILIEERLEGQEVSILGFCDGETIRLLPPSQDHKRIEEGDRGPNTGGMGVYTPVQFLNQSQLRKIETDIFIPMLKTMAKRGIPYRGILYAGLMVSDDGKIWVIEFNVRFGDPECQCVLPLLESDLAEVMMACTNGTLNQIEFKVKNAPACTVILASDGYPGNYETGKEITGLQNGKNETPDDIAIFHAGTKREQEKFLTNGGRVLAVTAFGNLGSSLPETIKRCYEEVEKIHFENQYYRRDIGQKGI